jgi:hypothetical protein
VTFLRSEFRQIFKDADLEARYALLARRDIDEDLRRRVSQMNPNPDYDASDELEYGIASFAWLLRGVYPPPSYAPDLGNAAGG